MARPQRDSFIFLASILFASVPVWGAEIVELPLMTNDIAYDFVTGRIYATVPSAAGATGNSIKRINPLNQTVEAHAFIGSEPNKIAISDTGQYLYAGLDGAAAVRRFDIAAFTAGLQFAMGSDGSTGPFYVEDMEVLPGNANAVAISRRNQGFSPRHEGVGIYENGLVRPTTTPDHTGSNVIEFGASANRLYGYNNETTDFGFRRMNVTASGVSILDNTQNIISGFGVDIRYAAGRVFATSGRVVDAEAHTLIGTIAASGLVLPDAQHQRVFFLTGSGSTRTIQAFDMNTYLLIDSFPVTGVAGTPKSLIRWGSDGLAFKTSSSELFIIRSDLVPEPGSMSLLGLASTFFIIRRRKN